MSSTNRRSVRHSEPPIGINVKVKRIVFGVLVGLLLTVLVVINQGRRS